MQWQKKDDCYGGYGDSKRGMTRTPSGWNSAFGHVDGHAGHVGHGGHDDDVEARVCEIVFAP